MEMNYEEFLNNKKILIDNIGFDINRDEINPILFDFQKDIVKWAIKKGRCAVFLDTGLGKTFIQLEWARLLKKQTLIIAPLSVAKQTIREAKKIGIIVNYIRSQEDKKDMINITNYEMIDSFSSDWGTIILDESSILKSLSGITKKKLIEKFNKIPFKLCCTATPAPNDFIELGNHTAFLGICSQQEMLSMFFINANKEHTFINDGKIFTRKGSNKGGQEWRLKHHAESKFFEWMAKWSITMTKPSDLGYEDDKFNLPPLNIEPIFVKSGYSPQGELFFTHLAGLGDRAKIRKQSIDSKIGIMEKLIIDRHTGFGLNLQYVDESSAVGIQQEFLCGQSGTGKGKSPELVSCQQRQIGQKEIEKIPSEILSGQHGEMGENNGNGKKAKRSQEKEVCRGFHLSGEMQKRFYLLAEEKSSEKEGSENKEIWNNHGAIRTINPEAAGLLCDLWKEGERRPQDISDSGPRSQNREGKGPSLFELQPGDREVPGQSITSEGGSRLPQWVIWCGLDDEQRAIEKSLLSLNISVSSVFGTLSLDEKEKRLESWLNGETQILLSKVKICGFGLNLQQASNMIFFGLNDSWETYYQAIRREWRFGQDKPVNVFILLSDKEREIIQNINRKEAQNIRLKINMIKLLKNYEEEELMGSPQIKEEYKEETIKKYNWTAMLGDSALRLKEIKDNSIDLSIYSPPFADLFIYSNSNHDLGNCRNWEQFFKQYTYILEDILRVTKLGRLTCVHTSDIPAMANRDGYIGLRDFPGEVIRLHEKLGWTFTGRCYIQKNPQAQAIRVKCKSLLFAQMNKDSSHSRPALIDQVLIFKKPGENQIPITPVKNGELDNEKWISWAHGIWTDIQETETLQYYHARARDDERHICPLQLGTIERCIKLYSNPGETILTPFMGIGSEAYMAIKLRRKTVGIELKESYFKTAIENLNSVQEELLLI